MGVIPFHWWAISLAPKLSWDCLALFFTFQKLIPLRIISLLRSSKMIFLAILGWLIRALGCSRVKRLKKLFIFSSLFFIRIIIYNLTLRNSIWVYFMITYTLFLLPMLFYFNYLKLRPVSYSRVSLIRASAGLWLIFLNLGGVPPMPGFFLKLKFLTSIRIATFEIVIFVIRSLLIIYLYIRFSLISTSNQNISDLLIKNKTRTIPLLGWFLLGLLRVLFIYMYGCNHVKFWILRLVKIHKAYFMLDWINYNYWRYFSNRITNSN